MAHSNVTDRPVWLVIAPDDYLDALRPLRRLRERQGFDTEQVAIEDVIADRPDLVPEAAISQYVADRHAENRNYFRYLFLVGDDVAGSPRSIPIGTYFDPTTGTAFATDAVYGNVDDGDPLPDIAVGRFPAASVEDVTSYVARVLAYERAPVISPARLASYAARGDELHGWGELLLGGFVYATADRIVPRDIQLDVAADPGSPFADGRSFLDLLNGGGNFLVTYLGHGSADSLQSAPSFDLASVAHLQTPGRVPIVNLLACGAGCFAQQDCLGEALIRAPHGPVAVFGSSVADNGVFDGSTSPVVLRYFGEALATFLQADEEQPIGDVFQAAMYQSSGYRHDFIWQVLGVLSPQIWTLLELKPSLNEGSRLQAMQLTLLGDPATRWRPRPTRAQPQTTPAPPLARDARTLLPPMAQATADRIEVRAPRPVVADVADTRSMTRSDAEVLLRLADYAAVWLHKKWRQRINDNFNAWFDSDAMYNDHAAYLGAWAGRTAMSLAQRSFPRRGDVRFVDGRFDVPLHDGGLALMQSDLGDAISQALGNWQLANMLLFDAHLRFAVQLTRDGILRFVDIDGVTFEDWSEPIPLDTTPDPHRFARIAPRVRHVRTVTIDFNYPSPCVTSVVDPPQRNASPVRCTTWGEQIAADMSSYWRGMLAFVSPDDVPTQ